MTKLQQLIKELCPNGVEYKTVQESVGVNRGKRLTKSQLSDTGKYEVYHGSKDSILGKYTQSNAPANTTIIVNTGGIGGVKFLKDPFWCSDGSFWLGQSDSVNSKYLYYCLSGYEDYFYERKRVGGVPTIDKSVIADFKIPIPPLPVQEEIVRILDELTEKTDKLISVLNAELDERKKQYEYYKESLFCFKEDVKRSVVGDVGIVTKLAGYEFTKYVTYSETGKIIALRGLNIKKGKLDLSNVKYVDESDFSKLERSRLHIGDMLFTYVGTVGQVAIIDEEDRFYLAPNVALIRFNSKDIIPKFMMYYFQTQVFFNKQINKLLQNSSMKNIPMEKIRLLEIPIPDVEKQQSVVELLEKADLSYETIYKTLSLEIVSRKKQYEYYRDKLLTF